MRLLFVSHSFPPPGQPDANIGGMQRVATELYEALLHVEGAPGGLVVQPCVLRTSWEQTHLRVAPFLVRTLRTLGALARQRGTDVVLFSSMVTAALALPMRRRLAQAGIRTAAIVHGRDVTLPVGVYQHLVPRVLNALDLVLPVSRATGEACLARGLNPARMQVVPNGIDVERFAAAQETAREAPALLPEAARAPGALRLLSVGRQVRRKGFAWLAGEVMPHLPPHVHYVLAGEGPEHDAIRTAAAQAGAGARVHLLGRVPDADLAALYRSSDLFVMPNITVEGDMEGFGVVLLEAGLNGLPVVAAALEGIRDVIAEGVNGNLVPSGDAAAFAAAIRRYTDQPEALAAARVRAREHVRQHFAWPVVARRYADVLGALAAR